MRTKAERIAVVTGANSGIGFEVARHLAEMGFTVVLACRSPDKARRAKEAIHSACPGARIVQCQLDLADATSICRAIDRLTSTLNKVDLLINNAGIMRPDDGPTETGVDLQFKVNHLGHFVLTSGLFGLLKTAPSARVVTVSSASHWFGRLDFETLGEGRSRPWRDYARSKLANLVFAMELDRRVRAGGLAIISVAAHPGWTVTQLQRRAPLIDLASRVLAMRCARGAAPVLTAAVRAEIRGGHYVGPGGPLGLWGAPGRARPAPQARDRVLGSRLWSRSEELTGAKFEI